MTTRELIKYTGKIKLDEKDKKILSILDKDARMSIADISKKTGIQRDSVIYRIKKMQEEKAIRFFHTGLNPSSLGYEIYAFVNFTLHNLDEQKEKKFIGYMNINKNVVYIAKTTGKWDFTIAVLAKSLLQFNEILSNIRMKFSDIIKEYDSSSIIQEYKFDTMFEAIE